jgi:4-amino-4-deoxy-L-arabinose transferase-like glycosyltransferase
VLIFVTVVRLRVAGVPLERDEGEYAYAGQLILQGVPPYALAYNMKFPGTYYAYAGILALFGQTPWGIHVGLMLVNLLTIVLVFAIGRRLLGVYAGAVAAASFGILSLDRWIYGVFAHANHFVVLAALVGLWVLLRAIESERLVRFFWSGLALGLSFLMKQHAIFYLPFAAAFVFWGEARRGDGSYAAAAKKLGVMTSGVALPLAVVAITLAVSGVWPRFWFWTIRYGSAYASEVPLAEALPSLAQGFLAVIPATLTFWVVGASGLLALWTASWEPRARVFVTGLAVVSFLAICPGFYFRPHYFILALPAVALLCGVAVESARRLLARALTTAFSAALALVIVFVPIGIYVTKEWSYLFSMGGRELSRSLYAVNPFVEAVAIGEYLRERTDANDRIAIFGSEPEIYFYAGRKAATGYIYTYALMEPQPFAKSMQDEMIREIERAHPRYLVFAKIDTSWSARDDSHLGITDFARRYVDACYEVVGVVDIVSPEETNIRWDVDAVGYEPRSSNLVYTFRRKSDAPCFAAP